MGCESIRNFSSPLSSQNIARITVAAVSASQLVCRHRHRKKWQRKPARIQLKQAIGAPEARQQVQKAAPLTGDTLECALKMRCDTAGAQYAIYWGNVGEEFIVLGTNAQEYWVEILVRQRGNNETFPGRCKKQKMRLPMQSVVGQVFMDGRETFIPDVQRWPQFSRKDLAKEFNIRSIVMNSFEGGTLEYGTNEGWTKAPDVPVLPRYELSKAFESFGASYAIFWMKTPVGTFVSVADFVTAGRRRALRSVRGDDVTFATKCKRLRLAQNSVVARVYETGLTEYIDDATNADVFTRAHLAEEFGVRSIRMVPTSSGVLEYGVPKVERLTGKTLAAILKFRCEMSGADYAIYWVGEGDQFAVSGDYVSSECMATLKEGRGDDDTFAKRCEKITLGPGSLVARVYREGIQEFVERPSQRNDFTRADLCREFLINSIVFQPVIGGVLEYGSNKVWNRVPLVIQLPEQELKRAFQEFSATYVQLWVVKGGVKYTVQTDYVLPEQQKAWASNRSDTETFSSCCRSMELWISSLVGEVDCSGIDKEIPDAPNCTDYEWSSRLKKPEGFKENKNGLTWRGLAKEFNIVKARLVACPEGVLEYGITEIMA